MPGLSPLLIDPLVLNALQEDYGRGDRTAELIIPAEQQGRAVGLAKASGIVAGLPVARRAFALVDDGVSFTACCTEGQAVQASQPLFEVRGALRSILIAERVAL